jgi:hypothetical protein
MTRHQPILFSPRGAIDRVHTEASGLGMGRDHRANCRVQHRWQDIDAVRLEREVLNEAHGANSATKIG